MMSPARPNLVRSLTPPVILACSLSGPLVATAQQTDQGTQPALQEVVVTAQKRAANIEDVPFSVSATSQQQIIDSGSQNLIDLARNIASFTVADLGPGQSQMAIRGISSGQVIRDQPGVKEQVGVYLDESPISVALFTPDLELFDLDRFEVLRGPQGTLFGAGSEAGTVRYITHQPDLGRFEAFTDASYESVEFGSRGGSVRGAFNAPLGDTAAVRLVLYYHHLPGFIDAIQPDGSVKQDVNDGDRTGVRLSFLWKPNDQLSITPRVVYQNLDTNGFPRVDQYNILANPYTTVAPVTIGNLQQYTQQRESLLDQFLLTDLDVNWNLGSATLTSITSYTHRDVRVLRDATQLTGSVTFDALGIPDQASVRLTSPLYDRTGLNVFSQEVRVASNGNQNIDWLVGGFFQHVDRHYGQNLPTPGYDALVGLPSQDFGTPTADTPFYSDLSYRLKQYAAFGEATWHMTSQWAVTAGLRYYKYTEDKNLLFGGAFGVVPEGVPGQTCATGTGQPPLPTCVPQVTPASTDSSGTSPRFIVSYKPTDDAQLYAQAARGFRLGGINDPINLLLCSPTDKLVFGNNPNWKDEKTWDYELGAKTQWLDKRLTFNLDVFYSDIKDLQATTTAGTCSSRVVFNVPTARSAGVEMELFARPNINWDFGVTASYIDAKLTSSVTSTLPTGETVVVGGLQDGNRLPTAPKTQAAAYLGYTMPVASQRDFFANFTVQYVGSSFSQFENEQPGFGNICTGCPTAANPYAARLDAFGGPLSTSSFMFDPELPSYTIGNLRLGLKSDRWQAAFYINNLWDETAHTALDYERGRTARLGYLTNQPRTYGLYGSYSF
ncbi:MAG TPA: TonB-dependent receptor [Steroidobacteraceae bacterium]|jgi:iron complex outermembrane receptor protein|nr:TonB-dependent receptor [Steroidobacteraceae bacterium]